MISLKELEAWCYLQIDLMNRLYDLEDFPNEVEFCGRSDKFCLQQLKSVHIFTGIEKISVALKLPINIELADDYYKKTVTHLGVKFFQIEYYPKIQET